MALAGNASSSGTEAAAVLESDTYAAPLAEVAAELESDTPAAPALELGPDIPVVCVTLLSGDVVELEGPLHNCRQLQEHLQRARPVRFLQRYEICAGCYVLDGEDEVPVGTSVTAIVKSVTVEDYVGATRQWYCDVGQDEWKLDTLCDIYEALTPSQCVIFCNTDRQVFDLQDQLERRDFTASTHPNMDRGERFPVPRPTATEFRRGATRIMICRDLWHPALDMPQVSVYIHFDIAPDAESHARRFRSPLARARMPYGDPVVLLVGSSDRGPLQELQRHFSTPLPEMPFDIADLL